MGLLVCTSTNCESGNDLRANCRYRVSGLATWPSGSGNGLQSRPRGFDSRRRLSNVRVAGCLILRPDLVVLFVCRARHTNGRPSGRPPWDNSSVMAGYAGSVGRAIGWVASPPDWNIDSCANSPIAAIVPRTASAGTGRLMR